MSFLNQYCCDVPVWMILAGTAMTALTSGLLVIRRKRRAKRLRQYKERARQMLMEVRRSCVLPQAVLPLNQVPGMVRRIKLIAEAGGFRLDDIGTSARQLDKFLMIARDGKVAERRPRTGPVPSDERWLLDRPRAVFERPHAIELPPPEPASAAPPPMVVEKYPSADDPAAVQPDQWSNFDVKWSDFDTSRPLLGEEYEEIVIEPGDSGCAQPADDGSPLAASRIGERWFSSEDLGGESGAAVDEMFDRIVRSDEAAQAKPAQAVTIRVDGKKFGL